MSTTRVVVIYAMPLAEVIYDLYDKLKSATKGYASMDYNFSHYQAADMVKMFFKEDWIPPFADRRIFVLAPIAVAYARRIWKRTGSERALRLMERLREVRQSAPG